MNEYTTCLYPDSQRIWFKIYRNICKVSITAIQFRLLFLKHLAFLSYISFCLISFIFMLSLSTKQCLSMMRANFWHCCIYKRNMHTQLIRFTAQKHNKSMQNWVSGIRGNENKISGSEMDHKNWECCIAWAPGYSTFSCSYSFSALSI